jgi:hypothetical protein
MSPNPLYNALAAVVYIVGIVSLITFVIAPGDGPEPSVLIPMMMLSLLVLSVAVMAYLFFYQPIIMLLDGKRQEAVKFFLNTVGIFACSIVVLFVAWMLISG